MTERPPLPVGDSGDASPFERSLAAIDAANAADPNEVVDGGVRRPRELVHADVVERWVRTLAPTADEVQILAARAHHLRRWIVPRSDYPEGRAGYLRWRRDAKVRQAREVRAILAEAGYDPAAADRVAALVAKQTSPDDPAGQVHEDALCLAFVELQFDALVDRLGRQRSVAVVAKTLHKMSPVAIELAASVPLTERSHAVLADAVRAVTAEG